jgi:hypothetical protein
MLVNRVSFHACGRMQGIMLLVVYLVRQARRKVVWPRVAARDGERELRSVPTRSVMQNIREHLIPMSNPAGIHPQSET